jgi:membrane protease YdiL (CAAX protease family)
MEMADPDLATMVGVLFILVIVAALFEETVFRGFLF